MEKEPKGDDGGDLKLLGLTVSPFVIRVRMVLQMKAVSYRYIEQDLFIKSDLLVTSNPVYKKVPVLIHGGKPILESLAIVQYIDEAWSGKAATILPADPYQRATARFWTTYVDDKLSPQHLHHPRPYCCRALWPLLLSTTTTAWSSPSVSRSFSNCSRRTTPLSA